MTLRRISYWLCCLALALSIWAIIEGAWWALVALGIALILFGSLAHNDVMNERKAREVAHYERLKQDAVDELNRLKREVGNDDQG